MVKIFFIGVLNKDGESAAILKSAAELSTFGFFQRNSIDDFLKFTSKMVIGRMELATRTSVKEQNYICHAYTKVDNLAVAIITDEEYPPKVAHTLTLQILEEFPQVNLEEYLKKYQDPKNADAIMRLQADLEETKIILHNSITNILKRGEKLDDLVAKSEDLSSQSKLFYKTARKTNQCCQLF